MVDLQQHSIDVIRAGQFDGAYAACLSFSQYGYSWLRDGAWIAQGMDAAGQRDSARQFYLWAGRTLLRYADKVAVVVDKRLRGEPLLETDYLPTRFELNGELRYDDWPNFQLDGYGAWLWCAVDHVRRYQDHDLWQTLRPAVALTIEYLAALWQSPNYDCWEEHREHIHTSTLAALYGGLCAVAELDSSLVPSGLAATIQEFVLSRLVAPDGHFMKFLGNPEVDASLLWLAVPYRLVDVRDPRFQQTVATIERDIHRDGGGVYRYRGDTYYGGGEWLLLTAWLAWAYLELGAVDRARTLMTWVEAQAQPNGDLPEQVSQHVLAPEFYEGWVTRWGTSASPLLWSHGMYLLVKSLLKD